MDIGLVVDTSGYLKRAGDPSSNPGFGQKIER